MPDVADVAPKAETRRTFLVNVWLNHRPSNCQRLSKAGKVKDGDSLDSLENSPKCGALMCFIHLYPPVPSFFHIKSHQITFFFGVVYLSFTQVLQRLWPSAWVICHIASPSRPFKPCRGGAPFHAMPDASELALVDGGPAVEDGVCLAI